MAERLQVREGFPVATPRLLCSWLIYRWVSAVHWAHGSGEDEDFLRSGRVPFLYLKKVEEEFNGRGGTGIR